MGSSHDPEFHERGESNASDKKMEHCSVFNHLFDGNILL